MKRIRVLIAVAVFVCLACSAMAKANNVNVSGNFQNEGKLIIDVDWTIDSANYPGMSRDAVRQKVQDQIWDQMLPKIVDATKGASVSFDKSNFVLVKEYTDLIQRRPNGTKLYALKLQVEFNAPTESAVKVATAAQPAAAQPAAVQPAPEKPKKDINKDQLKQRWDNEL